MLTMKVGGSCHGYGWVVGIPRALQRMMTTEACKMVHTYILIHNHNSNYLAYSNPHRVVLHMGTCELVD